MPRSTKKRDKAKTQAIIRQAALECFSQNGADRTTIVEIAKRAKVPPSLIHYYYSSQEELYGEVFLLVLEHIRENVLLPLEKKSATGRDALLAYLRAHWDWARRFPSWYGTWLYFYYASALRPEYRAIGTEVRVAGRKRVASLIYAGLHEKHFSLGPGSLVEDLAFEIQAIVIGAWVMGGTEEPRHNKDFYRLIESRILKMLTA